MRSSEKSATKRKRRGRPPAPRHRPVLSARVPEDLLGVIQASARAHRRNASEELMWLAARGYAWEEARGTIEAWLSEVRRRNNNKLPVEQMLQQWGFTEIPTIDSTVTEPKWAISNPEVVREKMAEMAAVQAIERILKQS